MRTAAEFQRAVRDGRRAGRRTLVVHARWDPHGSDLLRVGLVVGRSVGDAVVRNRVKRRLRHVVGDQLDALPRGLLVLRALPAARTATSTELGVDLDRALARLVPSAVSP